MKLADYLAGANDRVRPEKGLVKLALQRWERALVVMERMTPHDRKKHFKMSDWAQKTPCGTVGCLAGHCALDPWFKRRGLKTFWEESYETVRGRFKKVLAMRFFGSPEDFFDPARLGAGLSGWYIFYSTSLRYPGVKKLVIKQIKALKELLEDL